VADLAGIRGLIAHWDWQTSISQAKEKFSVESHSARIDFDAWRSTLATKRQRLGTKVDTAS
jgi:hypothetical protein